MNELATLLEWVGTGLVGLLTLIVVIMMAGVFGTGVPRSSTITNAIIRHK
jgi:hypothetical protein